jgi:hypothetical protein
MWTPGQEILPRGKGFLLLFLPQHTLNLYDSCPINLSKRSKTPVMMKIAGALFIRVSQPEDELELATAAALRHGCQTMALW